MNRVMQYLQAEGQHPVLLSDNSWECVSPNGEHIVQVTADHRLLVDSEEVTIDEAFEDIVGEGLREHLKLLTTLRRPSQVIDAFVSTGDEAEFISYLGGVVYRVTDRCGESVVLRELRDGDVPTAHIDLYRACAEADNTVVVERERNDDLVRVFVNADVVGLCIHDYANSPSAEARLRILTAVE